MADERRARPPVDIEGRLQVPVEELPDTLTARAGSLPPIGELSSLTNDELFELLQEIGVENPLPQLVADTFGYASEMSKITNIGTEGFIEREVSRLLDPYSGRRGLLNMARATQRAFLENAYAQEGPNQEFIRISEDDEHTCDRCDDLAGTIGTFREHIAYGRPGAASCDGGDLCRCVLVLLD